MRILKALFISITFWQLAFSPIAFASSDLSAHGLTNVIKQYNLKNYSGKELVQLVKNYDNKTHLALIDYLQKNGVTDFNKISNPKVQYLNDKQYKITADKKDFIVTLLDADSINITYKSNSTTLLLKDGNVDQWMNALNALNINAVSFNFTELFISDAHALSYVVLIAAGVILAALGIKYLTSTMPLDNAVAKGKISCKDVNDESRAIHDDTKIRNDHAILSKVYADRCSKIPSDKACVEANKLIECLNGFLNPNNQQAASQRNTKEADAISNDNENTSAEGSSK